MFESLDELENAFRREGASQLFAKRLSPNDNSKNQIYLGGGFGALDALPHGEIYIDKSNRAGSKRSRPKASVEFRWLSDDGIEKAPHAQLILYPDYPEVRLSGLLMGVRSAPNELLRSRDFGRLLFLGVTPKGEIIGYLAGSEQRLSKEFIQTEDRESIGVLEVWGVSSSSKTRLLRRLASAHASSPIASMRLDGDGNQIPYLARNAGGYTLEAHLGITPNSIAGPDFAGWEVKQYSVRNFATNKAKSPVTLLTPEPDGGIYYTEGAEFFTRQYGYKDKNGVSNRINFGGIYKTSKDFHHLTGLKLVTTGFDPSSSTFSTDGHVSLIDREENIAASWSFLKLLPHWTTKHSRAAYIPSMKLGPPPAYAFGNLTELFKGPDFIKFLNACQLGHVYYDPAIKITNADGPNARTHRRSQFRIKHENLGSLYDETESVDLKNYL